MLDGAGSWCRLSAMMALIYAVQGAWWPMLAVHLEDLHISGRSRGCIFATFALASILTPLGAGHLADRKIPTQKLMSLIYGLGTFLLALLASGWVLGTAPILTVSLIYWLLTAPALGLGASLALRNLARPAQQFGGVRLWGTVGWMAIGWVVATVMALTGAARSGQGAYEAFWVAAAVSGIVSLYCLTLPHTPPLATEDRKTINLGDAVALARKRPVATYLLLAFGVCLTTPFVYQAVPPYLRTLGMPRAGIALAMTLGQTLEIVTLAALPWLLNRFGTKATLAMGVAAWVTYYVILICRLPLAASLLAIPFNGVAIACFHVAGQMFLDSQAPSDRRAGAQSLYLVATSGAGTLLGSLLAGEVVGRLRSDYAAVFWVPCLIDLTVLVALLISFRPTFQVGFRPNVSRVALAPLGHAASPLASARLAPDTPDR
jgi:MFS family permease